MNPENSCSFYFNMIIEYIFHIEESMFIMILTVTLTPYSFKNHDLINSELGDSHH